MSLIADASFIDLYLGHDFTDVKGLQGQPRRVAAPAEWQPEIEQLKAQCQEQLDATEEPEFSIVIEDSVVFRVTYMLDVYAKPLFVLNRSAAKILPLLEIGLPDAVHDSVMSEATKGLLFICGEMASGKTTSAASIVQARLEEHGGLALAVEDPPETPLHGLHGKGRCVQVPVSRRQGGYGEALIRALRTRADLIFVGEVRDTPTAVQVVQASINGHFIICTGHAGSVVKGIERIAVLAQPELPNAMQILSQGLIAVIHQTLQRSDNRQARLTLQCLSLTDEDAPAIREKIRQSQLQLLEQDIANQSSRNIWNDD